MNEVADLGSASPIRHMVVISHKRHDRLPDGQLAVLGGFSKIKKEFARHVPELILCVPVHKCESGQQIVSYPENISLVALPPYRGHFGFLRKLPRIVLTLWHQIGRADVVYAMAPNNMGILGVLLARIRRKPVFISIDTDRAAKARLRKTVGAKIKAPMVQAIIYAPLIALAGRRPAFITGDNFLGPRPYWRQWVKTTVTSEEMPAYQPISAVNCPLRIVFVGRLSHEKNISCLLEAVALLRQKGFLCCVDIVGDGPMKDDLQTLTRSLQVAEVAFRGVLPNEDLRISRFLGADVLVLPSKEERQGKVLLEAMACSVPVVAAAAGGIPSVISDGENGLLFNPDTPLDLANALQRIASDSALRLRLIENGYRFAYMNTLDRGVKEIMHEVSEFYGFACVCSHHGVNNVQK
jgi:glycosyltransferase involved in cell wall biosynthesis